MTSPKEILQARGIAEQALLAEWQELDSDFWEYPVFAPDGSILGYRQKKMPHSTVKGFKYAWKGGKPKDPNSDWYPAKGLKEAIAKAEGVVYIANGEPARLAYQAAGIENVIATTLSEVAVPKNILSYFQDMSVSRALYPVDKDKAGERSAQNWHDALIGTGIDFEALSWPDTMPEKADGNDVYIALNFDSKAFRDVLKTLKPLALETSVKTPKTLDLIDFSKTPQGLIDTIANRLNIQAWDSDGFSRKNVICLFHDDKEESAGFNKISGVMNCFACGAHSPKDVAERLGIRWQDYYPKREKKVKKQAETIQEIILDLEAIDWIEHPAKPIYINTAWINQPELPISWIKPLLHLTHSKSITVLLAIELHRAIYRGLIDGQDFTMKDILSVFNHPRKSTSFAVEFLTSLNYVSILHTNLLEEEAKTKSTQKDSVRKKQGRPETHYRLNTHTPSLAIALAERLEPVLLERLSEDLELAPRNHLLRDALDLDLVEFKAWVSRTNTAKHEYITEFISEKICDVLENTSYIEFSEKDLEHPSNLRGKLLKLILEPYSEALITKADGSQVLRERTGAQISRAKLAWELGCSNSAMTNLYQENNIGTKEIYEWYEVANPNGADIEKELREAPYNINKEVGGVAYGGVLHYWDYGILKKTKLLQKQDLIVEFEKHNHKLEKLYLQVQQPSLLWNMTNEEIALKTTKDAEIATKALDSAESDTERYVALVKLEKAQGKQAPRKKSVVSGKDRLYTGLSPEFVRKEIEKEVIDFTKYVLKGLAITDETSGEIIHSAKSLREVVIWLNKNTSKSVVKTAPKSKQANIPPLPKLPELPKLPIKQEEGVFVPIDWTKNQDLFNERMKAIGAI